MERSFSGSLFARLSSLRLPFVYADRCRICRPKKSSPASGSLNMVLGYFGLERIWLEECYANGTLESLGK